VNRIFVTGGSGLLGTNLAVALRDTCSVTLALHARQVSLARVRAVCVSLEQVDDVARALDQAQPSVVVHAAGLADVERCERDPALARRVNVDLAANVAAACARHRIPLVHVSTDHLFAGHDALVDETHPLAPLNSYARTKASGEQAVLERCADALIVRTNFYGWGTSYRRSFSDAIVRALRRGEPIRLFDDVFYTPILVEPLAHAVCDLVRLAATGVVHVVGDERVSKHEFGVRLARQFHLDASVIQAGSIHDLPGLAPRPRDMSLSNAHAARLLGRALGGVDAHLARLQAQESSGLAGELGSL
jgi:dTDP-4-dehydrorhamnose reductase